MKNYAFIGLGSLGMCMLESISEVTDQIIVIDKDSQLIDRIKDLVKTAYVADVLDEDALTKILPEGVDVAIIDIPSDLEASILVIHRLKQLGVPEIIVKSDTDSRNEILKLVGATRIVNADHEAAARIVPLVLASSLYNFMPIGGDLVLAEVLNPDTLVGKTLIEADLRRKAGINVIAVRKEEDSSYQDFDRDYKLKAKDHLLVAGKEKAVFAFSDLPLAPTQKQRGSTFGQVLKAMFKLSKKKKNPDNQG